MATQIFETNPAILLPHSTNANQAESCDAGYGEEPPNRSAFRGFFFAMLFNVFLFLTAAAGWEVWRLLR